MFGLNSSRRARRVPVIGSGVVGPVERRGHEGEIGRPCRSEIEIGRVDTSLLGRYGVAHDVQVQSGGGRRLASSDGHRDVVGFQKVRRVCNVHVRAGGGLAPLSVGAARLA